ncbi:MAG: O-antigen ligase family protein [Planctomycetota bacterium]
MRREPVDTSDAREPRADLVGLHASAQSAFDRQHTRDELGTKLHLLLGCLALLCAAGPNSVAELGLIPLVLYSFVRLNNTWRTFGGFFRQPAWWCILAWCLWQWVAVLWSEDTAEAIDQAGATRFALLPLMLWPVLDRRGPLLASLCAGFLIGHLAQLGHASGVEWLTRDRLPGRNSGWWDPAVAGSLLMVPLGMHLASALHGAGRWRLVGVCGVGITALALLATGTRGAWLASTALLPIALLLAAWQVRPRRRLLRPAIALVSAVLIGGTLALVVAGDGIRQRVEEGRAEVASALESQDYETSTGRRVLMYRVAWEAFIAHPIVGVGTGDYAAWGNEQMRAEDRGGARVLAHAHCGPLHLAATQGLIGLALAGVASWLVFTGATARPPSALGGYERGPALALVGLLLVSAFDAIQVNAQTALMLGILAAFATTRLPARVGWNAVPSGVRTEQA